MIDQHGPAGPSQKPVAAPGRARGYSEPAAGSDQERYGADHRRAGERREAPGPRKLAKALTKETLLDKDAESRWCGGELLRQLVRVLGR